MGSRENKRTWNGERKYRKCFPDIFLNKWTQKWDIAGGSKFFFFFWSIHIWQWRWSSSEEIIDTKKVDVSSACLSQKEETQITTQVEEPVRGAQSKAEHVYTNAGRLVWELWMLSLNVYTSHRNRNKKKVITWAWREGKRLLWEREVKEIREMWCDWQEAPKTLLSVLVMIDVRTTQYHCMFFSGYFPFMAAGIVFMENWN